MSQKITTAVFDLGNVLIAWDPRHLYREMFGDETEMEYFLTELCSPAWNLRQDGGRTFAEAVAEIAARAPAYEKYAAAWLPGFDKMMPGAIEGSVALLAELRARGVPLYALTNWSAETFPFARRRFDFLNWFDGLVMSAEEKLVKPDPEIFRRLLARYALDPARCLFIDDNADNVAAAAALGFQTHRFTSPAALGEALRVAGLLAL